MKSKIRQKLMQGEEQKQKLRLERREDWPERLHECLDASRVQTFAWGVSDCALFLCNAVLAMTDTDLAAGLRGTYTGERTAAKAMVKFIGDEGETQSLVENLAVKVAAHHAIAEIPPALAQRGDAVLFDSQDGPALGVVAMDGV